MFERKVKVHTRRRKTAINRPNRKRKRAKAERGYISEEKKEGCFVLLNDFQYWFYFKWLAGNGNKIKVIEKKGSSGREWEKKNNKINIIMC